MLPVIHNVVHVEGRYDRPLGRLHECVHTTHIVACHVRAGGRYVCGREELTVRAPYLGVLPAGERDANGLVGSWEMYWCAFDWAGVRSETGRTVLLDLNSASVRRSHLRQLGSAEVRDVVALFRALMSLWRQPDISSQIRCGNKVLELLAMWAEPPVIQGEEKAVRLYRNLIDQYAQRADLSLSQLAERIGLSADHLGVLFQREMGMTPSDYRTRLRLLRARELLVSTAKPVSEVARESGFPDANYFARVFRKVYGMSPREFSRSNLPGVAV
jgi:AraC-like DNA-binding protein